jgi:hypothetical protein
MGFVGQLLDANNNPAVNVTLTLNDKSQLGAAAETLKSVKFNAPRYYSAQNRAVTSKDYEAIIRNIYPNAKYVNAFGGELLDPPVYGKVIVSIKTTTGGALNNLTKKDLIAKLRPYAMASVETVITDPDEFFVNLSIFVSANTFKSVLSENVLSQNTSDDIRKKILAAIQDFGDQQDLGNFGKTLSLSQLEKIILNSDANINDVQFGVTPYKVIPYEDLTSPTTYDVNFGIALECSCDSATGETVKSSGFFTPGISERQYIEDNGSGGLISYYIQNNKKVITNNNIGSYNCETGKVKVGPITTYCPPDGDCPNSLVISIKTKNSGTITPPAGTLISIPTPDITIGNSIPDAGPGASVGDPNSFTSQPSTFTFTSPVSTNAGSSSCFV